MLLKNPFASKSYLVVDDFGDMRSMIKGLLRSLGADDIDAARDGKEAVALMEKRHYQVVLCDYNLGKGKDGQQVLEEARKRRLINVATVFVMITAENSRDMVMGAVEYEPDSYLSKPFTKDLLRTRLEKLFQRKADLQPVNAALEKNDYAQAISLIEQRLGEQPKNAGELLKLQAETYLRAGNHERALKMYESQLASRDLPWARFGLGKVQYAMRQFALAKQTFEHLLETNKTFMAAYDWLAKSQSALGCFDDAQTTLSAASALSPKAIQRQHALGELALQNEDFATAEQAFGNAVKLGTHSVFNHPSLYAGLAHSKSSQGRHDEAMQVVSEIDRKFDDETARFYAATAEAVVKQQSGDAAGAGEAMQRAEEIHSRNADTLPASLSLDLAKTASTLGLKEKANDILRAAVQNNHDDEDFMVVAAGAYRAAGLSDDPEKLIRGLRQDVVKMNNKGVSLIKERHFDEAIDLFREAAEGMPGNKVINRNMALACVMKMEDMGVDEESMTLARKFLDRTGKLTTNDTKLAEVARRFTLLLSADAETAHGIR